MEDTAAPASRKRCAHDREPCEEFAVAHPHAHARLRRAVCSTAAQPETGNSMESWITCKRRRPDTFSSALAESRRVAQSGQASSMALGMWGRGPAGIRRSCSDGAAPDRLSRPEPSPGFESDDSVNFISPMGHGLPSRCTSAVHGASAAAAPTAAAAPGARATHASGRPVTSRGIVDDDDNGAQHSSDSSCSVSAVASTVPPARRRARLRQLPASPPAHSALPPKRAPVEVIHVSDDSSERGPSDARARGRRSRLRQLKPTDSLPSSPVSPRTERAPAVSAGEADQRETMPVGGLASLEELVQRCNAASAPIRAFMASACREFGGSVGSAAAAAGSVSSTASVSPVSATASSPGGIALAHAHLQPTAAHAIQRSTMARLLGGKQLKEYQLVGVNWLYLLHHTPGMNGVRARAHARQLGALMRRWRRAGAGG